MKRFIILYFISFLFPDEPYFQFNGYVNFANISRLSDNSLIDLPYRMGSLDFSQHSNNISLSGNFTLEYQMRKDTYFLGSKDPQDFRWDMRELYGTISNKQFDFRFGKQIHSWGSVDANSPIDNASAFDYYYIFFLVVQRKNCLNLLILYLNLKIETGS